MVNVYSILWCGSTFSVEQAVSVLGNNEGGGGAEVGLIQERKKIVSTDVQKLNVSCRINREP